MSPGQIDKMLHEVKALRKEWLALNHPGSRGQEVLGYLNFIIDKLETMRAEPPK